MGTENPYMVELFAIAEEPLGLAWLADTEGDTNAEVLAKAQASAYWAQVGANQIRGFIRRRRKEIESNPDGMGPKEGKSE